MEGKWVSDSSPFLPLGLKLWVIAKKHTTGPFNEAPKEATKRGTWPLLYFFSKNICRNIFPHLLAVAMLGMKLGTWN